MAIASGADIVDLKEPRSGPLSPTAIGLWQQVDVRWQRNENELELPRLSAALGERSEAIRVAGHLPARFDFAKAGPSGCDSEAKLWQLWSDVRHQLDDRIELIGVAYADWEVAGSLDPESVFRLAKRFGIRRCLLDTFCKDGTSSLAHLGLSTLGDLAQVLRRLGLWWSLAGSMRSDDVALLRAAHLLPDCFGVRGDVCQGASRQDRLQSDRIDIWLRELKNDPQANLAGD